MSQAIITEDGVRIELPEGPKCRKCGHEPCPCCRDFCDSIAEVDGEPEPCPTCWDTGGCDFEPAALEAWLRQIDALQGREYEPPKPPETEEERAARKQREEIASYMRFGKWIRNSDGKKLETVDEVLETMRVEGSAFFKSGISR